MNIFPEYKNRYCCFKADKTIEELLLLSFLCAGENFSVAQERKNGVLQGYAAERKKGI